MDNKRQSIKQLLRERFECYRAKDVVLVRKLQRTSGLTEDHIVKLLKWWHSEEESQESLLGFLVTNELLSKDALDRLNGKRITNIRSLDDFLDFNRLKEIESRIKNGKINEPPKQSVPPKKDEQSTSKKSETKSLSTKGVYISAGTVPRVGTRLGKCLLTDIIGKGTSCIVFKGTHETLQIPVAVKVFLPQNNSEAEIIRKQFGAEAQTLAKLNHRSIVRILDFEDTQHPYLILEYVDGKSLEELLKEQGCIDYQQASYYIYCIAGGLLAAHESGIIHRDIKPANILVTQNNTAKLADLGIAHITRSAQWETMEPSKTPSALPGTPAYIAPELAFYRAFGRCSVRYLLAWCYVLPCCDRKISV